MHFRAKLNSPQSSAPRRCKEYSRGGFVKSGKENWATYKLYTRLHSALLCSPVGSDLYSPDNRQKTVTSIFQMALCISKL
ncbi:unnamed protein product [Protopolystoma xenopodis]|uniref:Uncharacterized protein n=1 Tax=Protopolystoma xenopodis TaxID=117903 RepID=A0A3S5A5K0_9PLAT|nr:unnamed protein product [Protopolystoma xenopodis]